MAKVAVYVLQGNGSAHTTCEAMANGARVIGDEVTVFADTAYRPRHLEEFDTAVMWGYVETCQEIMNAYRSANWDQACVYFDLAYWERGTHYKVSVNNRHPTAYFQRTAHDNARIKDWGISTQPYPTTRDDKQHILLAGMSAKAAWVEGLEPEVWERRILAEIKQHTNRPVIYRPKPSWMGAKPIEGSKFSSQQQPLLPVLTSAHAVVSHHSNVCVDGLAAGVPAFVWDGVSVPMGLQDLSRIEDPYYPEGREQWLNDISYCQWSLAEMRDGTVWRHLKSEELVAP